MAANADNKPVKLFASLYFLPNLSDLGPTPTAFLVSKYTKDNLLRIFKTILESKTSAS